VAAVESDFTLEEREQILNLEKERRFPPRLQGVFFDREGARLFVERLPKLFMPGAVAKDSPEQKIWEAAGTFNLARGRFHEAIPIFAALYDHMLAAQEQTGIRCHKGMPLVWLSECHRQLGHPLISLRLLMLTLIEDAIVDAGRILANRGVYFRVVWIAGLADADVRRYATEAYAWSQDHPREAFFPERVLRELDQNWVCPPAPSEVGIFPGNPRYMKYLIGRLGEKSGLALQLLAEYLLASMPGCRTMPPRQSGTHEYDIVCSMEGSELDFRSELGRYFVCECKDWKRKADVRTVAILCRVLDSVKARFGILFSRSGITGAEKDQTGELEQLKIFQDRGSVIVVFEKKDLEQLAKGANFVAMLREKYERVRLDLKGG
jgi:hypothetical protein